MLLYRGLVLGLRARGSIVDFRALGEAENGPHDSHIRNLVTPQPGHEPHADWGS